MTSTFTPSQNAIATALVQDRPTIDAAVKSFLSLFAARSLTRDDSTQQQEALVQARSLLKAINQYTFPLLPDPSDDYKMTAHVWNSLIASQTHKPSQVLGRNSLKLAWQYGLPKEIPNSNDSLFVQEFASLLQEYDPTTIPTDNDSDACLVWDVDQGAAELSRRRSRRAARAKDANEQSSDQQLTIEELPEDEEVEASEGNEATVEEIPSNGSSKKDPADTASS